MVLLKSNRPSYFIFDNAPPPGLTFFGKCRKRSDKMPDKCLGRMGAFGIDRAIIRICFGFALLRLVIGLKKSHHFLSQSEVKPQPIVTRSRTFSRPSDASATRNLYIEF